MSVVGSFIFFPVTFEAVPSTSGCNMSSGVLDSLVRALTLLDQNALKLRTRLRGMTMRSAMTKCEMRYKWTFKRGPTTGAQRELPKTCSFALCNAGTCIHSLACSRLPFRSSKLLPLYVPPLSAAQISLLNPPQLQVIHYPT